MAKSPTEQIRELQTDFSILREKVETQSRDLKELRTDQKMDGVDLAELKRQMAVLTQRLDDHVKRVETWDNRRWGLILLMAGALLSLASGLIVALARK